MDNLRISIPRLEAALGENELRSYLAGKWETTGEVRQGESQPEWVQLPTRLPKSPKVLLLSPPITIPLGMQRRCIPPLGLCYIAASLEKHGFSVEILDACMEGYDHLINRNGMVTYGLTESEIESRLRQSAPDIIGASALFSTDLEMVVRLCGLAKRVLPKCSIVVGGLHPTIYPMDVIKLDNIIHQDNVTVDWIIRGEGEYRLPKLIHQLVTGKVDRNQDGLVGRVDGAVFLNPQRSTIANLDELPPPAYHLLPMERYFQINVPFSPVPKGKRVIQILTSRGCPISCSFCASTNLYKKYRTHSVERVIREIRDLQKEYNVDEVQFADDNLLLDGKRATDLMEAMSSLSVSWCTPNGTMVNTINVSLLKKMKQAGLYQITLSVDSANVRSLKEIHHKPVDLNRVPGLIQACRDLGIWTHGTLVVGMPGETLEEIEASLDRVLDEYAFTSISTFIAQAIPGSELYHLALENGWIRRDDAWVIDSTKQRMSLSGLPAERIENMVTVFQRKFSEKSRLRDPDVFLAKYANLLARGGTQEDVERRLT